MENNIGNMINAQEFIDIILKINLPDSKLIVNQLIRETNKKGMF